MDDYTHNPDEQLDQVRTDADLIAALRADLQAAESRADNLEVALTSARRIGTAIGILMCMHKVTSAGAFDMLTHISQRQNRKLRDIAEYVVDTGSLPPAATALDPN